MPRLPQPGSDQGTWGDILNDYLSQTHKFDGSLKDQVVSESNLNSGLQAALGGKADSSTLATIATSGNYDDLSNKPSIPAQFNPIAGTAVTLSGTYPNITFNATTAVSLGDLPAGVTLTVSYSGGVWPARPTQRTDLLVQWIDVTGSAPVPGEALVGDLVIRDAS